MLQAASYLVLLRVLQVGMITSFWDIEVVALAFLTTCVAVTVLALIACQVRSADGPVRQQHGHNCVLGIHALSL